jgi:hypothetical protein
LRTIQATLAISALMLAMIDCLHAQINPDPCQQVRSDDVATLVTLNQSEVSGRSESDSSRCYFEIKTPVDSSGMSLQLDIRHFSSHAEAVAYMKNELPFYFDKHPPLVKTTGPDDHVDMLLTGDTNAMAEAVHDNYMSTINISGIESGARTHPSFEYRLQKLALQAVGATVLPTVGIPPDPVPPKSSTKGSDTSLSSPNKFALPLWEIVLFVIAIGLIARLLFFRRHG